MGKSLVSGGNVTGALSPQATQVLYMQQALTQLQALRAKRQTRDKIVFKISAIAFLICLPVTIVFAVLAGNAAHNQYQMVMAYSSNGFEAHWQNANTLAGMFGVFLPIALISGALTIVALLVGVFNAQNSLGGFGEWLDDWGALVGYLGVIALLILFTVLFVPAASTGNSIDTEFMNEHANNWITTNLHVPTVMNYADNAEDNTHYVEYNTDHKAVKFTIQSSLDYVKVIPNK